MWTFFLFANLGSTEGSLESLPGLSVQVISAACSQRKQRSRRGITQELFQAQTPLLQALVVMKCPGVGLHVF